MPLTQAERDRKRLAALKESGGKNVLLRLPREEVRTLDFLARHYNMDKGKIMAKLIMEEARRVSSLLLSNPEELRRYVEKE